MRGDRQPGAPGALLVVVVGVAIVAIAQFTLDSLSLSSPSWHLIQHGIIAVGGVVIGVGATRLYQMGQPQAGRYPSAMAASLVLVVGAGLVTFGQFYVDSLPDLTQAAALARARAGLRRWGAHRGGRVQLLPERAGEKPPGLATGQTRRLVARFPRRFALRSRA